MRLIDADALKETLDYYIREAGWSEEINTALGWVKDDFIDAEPTVDAVPVIRCKDCKHHKGYNCDRLYGMQDAFMARDDDYCSRAERREDER